MSNFRTIEIDLDVHKLIEAERRNFVETENDALRRLLRLENSNKGDQNFVALTLQHQRAWADTGVVLPHGTRVRMTYNGRLVFGEILDGIWVIEGRSYASPSGAASGEAITKRGNKTKLDGWIYWEAKLKDHENWMKLDYLRKKAASDLNLDLSGIDLKF
ncbi:MAG: hypothetical protein O9333_11625 [Beijerinckiaceae bacterium]|jgi:hypothetical protein|nr:hypothetical protein [Beijerinckiaceae bacterium]